MSSKAAVAAIREQRVRYPTSSMTLIKPPRTSHSMKDCTIWNEPPPPFIITSANDEERISIRNANPQVYHALATTAIWKKCIKLLGCYVFDDCMQFHKLWKSTAKDSVTERNKVVWQSYHHHRMHNIDMHKTLKESAVLTAWPYLKEKDPDYLLATEIEYEEKEFFKSVAPTPSPAEGFFSNDETDETGWTEDRSHQHQEIEKEDTATIPIHHIQATTRNRWKHGTISSNSDRPLYCKEYTNTSQQRKSKQSWNLQCSYPQWKDNQKEYPLHPKQTHPQKHDQHREVQHTKQTPLQWNVHRTHRKQSQQQFYEQPIWAWS